MLHTVSIVILMLASLASILRLYQGTQETIDRSNETKIVRLALLSFVIALLGELILSSNTLDSDTLSRILSNLALYAGAPMLVSALLSKSLNRTFSMQNWGRYMLAVIALFELLRRMELGVQYSNALALVLISTLIIAGVISKRASSIIAGLLLAASFLTWQLQTGMEVEYLCLAGAVWLSCSSLKTEDKVIS